MQNKYEIRKDNGFFGSSKEKVKNNFPLKTGEVAYDLLTAYLKVDEKKALDLDLEGIEVDEALAAKIIQEIGRRFLMSVQTNFRIVLCFA